MSPTTTTTSTTATSDAVTSEIPDRLIVSSCSDCQNGGTCVSASNGLWCRCPRRTTGNIEFCYEDAVCTSRQPCDQVDGPNGGPSPSTGSSGSTTAIAGGVVGGILFVVVVMFLVLLYVRHSNRPPIVDPAYEQPNNKASAFDNPTFMAQSHAAGGGGAGDVMDGPQSLSNPFYGMGNGGPQYASAQYDSANGMYGTAEYASPQYEPLHEATYDQVHDGRASLRSNNRMQVEQGRLRLASVARSNPLNAESCTDAGGESSLDNPMYGAGGSSDGTYQALDSADVPGMDNPNYAANRPLPEDGSYFDVASKTEAEYTYHTHEQEEDVSYMDVAPKGQDPMYIVPGTTTADEAAYASFPSSMQNPGYAENPAMTSPQYDHAQGGEPNYDSVPLDPTCDQASA